MEFKVLNKTRQSVIIKTDLGNRHMNWDQFNNLMVINKNNPKVAEIQQEAALNYFEAEIYIARLLHLFAKGIDGLDDNVAARAFSKEVCELLGVCTDETTGCELLSDEENSEDDDKECHNESNNPQEVVDLLELVNVHECGQDHQQKRDDTADE